MISNNITKKLICNTNINTKIFLTFVQIFKVFNEATARAHGTILQNMYRKILMFFLSVENVGVSVRVDVRMECNRNIMWKGLTKDNIQRSVMKHILKI